MRVQYGRVVVVVVVVVVVEKFMCVVD